MTTHITKTWFDGEKVVTQEIPESEVYKQEPVAWQGVHDKTDLYYRRPVQGDVRPLYAAPPQPEQKPMHPQIQKMYEDYFDKCFRESSPPQRKPLTDEKVVEMLGNLRESITGNVFLAFARAIEAAHGIGDKNT